MPEKGASTQQKTKELKVFSTQVVTLDSVKRDKRKLFLLYIIRACNEISEKGLSYLIQMLKDEKNLSLGYTIYKIGNRVVVKELQDDVKALLYLGLVEVNPKNRKLRLTGSGQEFLDSLASGIEGLKELLQAVEELKPKVVPLDEEVSLMASTIKR